MELCDGIDQDCDGTPDNNVNGNTNPACGAFVNLGSISGDTGAQAASTLGWTEAWFRVRLTEWGDIEGARNADDSTKLTASRRQASGCRRPEGRLMSRNRLTLLALLGTLGCGSGAVETAGNPPPPPAAVTSPAETRADSGTARLKTAHVRGVTLHYEDRGAGEPVVFVHGSLMDFREWSPVVERLTDSFRTVTYSRRYNYPNANPQSGSDHSAAVEGEDLAALIRELGLGQAHLVGVSYGAYAALIATIRHPEIARSLTLVEPPLLRWVLDLPEGASLHADFFAMWDACRAAFLNGDSEEALRAATNWFIGPDSLDGLPPEVVAVLRSNLEEWRALTTAQDAFPEVRREEVRGIGVPVLMISGGSTYPILKLVDAELEKQLASGRRIAVPEGTHDICSAQPAVCADAIRAHLEAR